MARGLCDLCGLRPATVRLELFEGGRRRTLEVCEEDYLRLRREQEWFSPWEALFSSGFGELFPEGLLGRGRWGDREAVDIDTYLSDRARDLLQKAAQKAVDFGKDEVDTEHVLYALTESEVVEEILRGFKVSPEDIRGYIEHNAPRGNFNPKKGETVRLGLSPRVKGVLEQAFLASRDLGQSYIGPEHLLIGLVEEPDGLGGDLLRKYGLTPEGVRQQTAKVVGVRPLAEEGRPERRSATPTLDKYARDLTELARQGRLDPRHRPVEGDRDGGRGPSPAEEE
jgi:ATP-dependent Clp protease ATP-binding subunit ClpC